MVSTASTSPERDVTQVLDAASDQHFDVTAGYRAIPRTKYLRSLPEYAGSGADLLYHVYKQAEQKRPKQYDGRSTPKVP